MLPGRKRVPEFLKISEAAKLLGINPATLRRWDKQGIISPLKVGKRGDRRYKLSNLQKLQKNRPFSREKSQEKGAAGEDILHKLIKNLIKEWGFTPIELRSQKGGSQYGKDNVSSWLGKTEDGELRFEWSFEAKHYGKIGQEREIPDEKISNKLRQITDSSVPRDCWCIFSPFGYVSNDMRETISRAFEKKSYPFKIVLWTKDQEIKELISCFPEIYKKLYETELYLDKKKKKEILEKWKKLVVEDTNDGKILRENKSTQISPKTVDRLSSGAAKKMMAALQREGVRMSLQSSRDTPSEISKRGSQLSAEVVQINEEIDRILPLLDKGDTKTVLPHLSVLLGKIEDKDGFGHEKARVYNNIGVAYNILGETNKAIEYFNKAVKSESGFTVGLTNLASAYMTIAEKAVNEEERKKELEKAEKILMPLWEGFSEKSSPVILQVYMRLIRITKGVDGLISFIKEQVDSKMGKLFHTTDTLAFVAGSTYLEHHDYNKALEYAEEAYGLKKDAETVLLRGRVYLAIAIKENDKFNFNYWTDIVPVFSKKANLKKALQDIDEAMELATKNNQTLLYSQIYFLQKMGRAWSGEDSDVKPVDMADMEEQKKFLEAIDAFKKRDYESSFSILKSLPEYEKMPYAEKFRIARVYLYFGQPEITKEILDSLAEESIKRSDFWLWIDYSVVATLLGEKNQAILAASKARELAKEKGDRRTVLSHFGAVMLRYADTTKEGDRVLEGALAFDREFPELKSLARFDYNREEDKKKLIEMIRERQEWVKNIKDIYRKNPIPSYYLQKTFKQPYILVWSGRDPEMPLEFTLASEDFFNELELNYKKGKVFVFDYLSLLTLSRLNLLSELGRIFPKMQITFSLFDKIQQELLKKEDEHLRRLWNFLRKAKSIEIIDRVDRRRLKGKKINDIFEKWLIDTIILAKSKGKVMVTDDLRFLRFLKSEKVFSVNSWLILQKAKEKGLLDRVMYSKAIGKLAECFYTFVGFTGDDLYTIVAEDEFKLTARSFHLINQIFLPGSNYKSFAQVFVRFVSNMWRPGLITEDKIFWLDYLTGIFATLLEKVGKGEIDPQLLVETAPDFGLMWRIALKGATKEDINTLKTKFPEMLKQPVFASTKERIKEMVDSREKELNSKND